MAHWGHGSVQHQLPSLWRAEVLVQSHTDPHTCHSVTHCFSTSHCCIALAILFQEFYYQWPKHTNIIKKSIILADLKCKQTVLISNISHDPKVIRWQHPTPPTLGTPEYYLSQLVKRPNFETPHKMSYTFCGNFKSMMPKFMLLVLYLSICHLLLFTALQSQWQLELLVPLQIRILHTKNMISLLNLVNCRK